MMGRFSITLFAALWAVSLFGSEPKASALLLEDDFERTELGDQWRLLTG
ncbi:MAG: hypothetical protein VCA36_09885 [Opitutales bacterium]